jgi:hypothetical protein
MQRKRVAILYEALWALFAPSRGDSQHRGAAQRGSADTSASPLLIFVVILLLLMLSIFAIDLHRDELRALGFVGELRIEPALMGP